MVNSNYDNKVTYRASLGSVFNNSFAGTDFIFPYLSPIMGTITESYKNHHFSQKCIFSHSLAVVWGGGEAQWNENVR